MTVNLPVWESVEMHGRRHGPTAFAVTFRQRFAPGAPYRFVNTQSFAFACMWQLEQSEP